MTTDSPDPPRDIRHRSGLWFALSAAAVLVLSLTASLAPLQFRRLLILYAVYGAAAGFLMSWLASELCPASRRRTTIAAILLTLAGGGNLAWQSYTQLHAARRQQAAKQPKLVDFAGQFAATDPGIKSHFDPGFGDYIRFRASGVEEGFRTWRDNRGLSAEVSDRIGRTWPWALWAFELSLAGGIAGWMVRRGSAARGSDGTSGG